MRRRGGSNTMSAADNLGSVLFMAIYLAVIWFVLARAARRGLVKGCAGRLWIFLAYLLLGLGDLFHLGLRVGIFFLGLDPEAPAPSLALGWGYIVTAVTMTYFYIALFHAWNSFYGKERVPAARRRGWGVALYAALLAKAALVALPLNAWFGGDPSAALGFDFRIVSALPTYFVGGAAIYLFLRDARGSGASDRAHRAASLWYLVSFGAYSLTRFLVSAWTTAGLFMIPKTLAYLAALYHHSRAVLAPPETLGENL